MEYWPNWAPSRNRPLQYAAGKLEPGMKEYLAANQDDDEAEYLIFEMKEAANCGGATPF
jgi:hypothetical protein